MFFLYCVVIQIWTLRDLQMHAFCFYIAAQLFSNYDRNNTIPLLLCKETVLKHSFNGVFRHS